jgi:hypothetical protein
MSAVHPDADPGDGLETRLTVLEEDFKKARQERVEFAFELGVVKVSTQSKFDELGRRGERLLDVDEQLEQLSKRLGEIEQASTRMVTVEARGRLHELENERRTPWRFLWSKERRADLDAEIAYFKNLSGG